MSEQSSPSSPEDDLLSFAEEGEAAPEIDADAQPWKLLVVDDEQEVHNVTDLALADVQVAGRPLTLLHASSGAQAREIMAEHDDIAMILMDVVMETEHAGLDAVRHIREQLGNRFVRIVLRTGQPGQAPEREVITRYDINDYKEKTELTANKLFTCVYTGISAYRDLLALEATRQGLEQILEAAASLFELQPQRSFFKGVLQQLTGFLNVSGSAVLLRLEHLGNNVTVAAATGWLSGAAGRRAADVLSPVALGRVRDCAAAGESGGGSDYYAGYFSLDESQACVLYMPLEAPLSVAQSGLADRFCRHLAVVLNSFEQLR